MREILFRGKRIDNGEWVEGDLIASQFISPYQNGELYINGTYVNEKSVDGIVWCQGSLYRIAPSTVGQYTGLKDKNGKRIFERDIIKRFWIGAEIIYCVRYDGENARFIGKALNKSGFTTFDGDGEMFEVIGNITDKPELLEK